MKSWTNKRPPGRRACAQANNSKHTYSENKTNKQSSGLVQAGSFPNSFCGSFQPFNKSQQLSDEASKSIHTGNSWRQALFSAKIGTNGSDVYSKEYRRRDRNSLEGEQAMWKSWSIPSLPCKTIRLYQTSHQAFCSLSNCKAWPTLPHVDLPQIRHSEWAEHKGPRWALLREENATQLEDQCSAFLSMAKDISFRSNCISHLGTRCDSQAFVLVWDHYSIYLMKVIESYWNTFRIYI